MFSGIFNYDNPVWRFIGKFFDVIILNVLWVVCSLPIVTVGASTTAVYYVTLKLVRDEEGSTVKGFFKSFKENFKQSTIIWLILLGAGLILAFDLWFAMALPAEMSKIRTLLMAVFMGLLITYGGIFLYVFPLQAKFYNPVKRTLFNAFFMAIRYFPATLGMLAISVVIPVLALFYVPMLIPVLFMFGFALFAFINSFMLVGIFDRYIPKEEQQ